MSERFKRTELIIGDDALNKLSSARIAVFGIGGVGGYVVESLARCGVGAIDIIDNDTVSISNLNRQIYALESTLGKLKVDVAKQRIKDINPYCTVTAHAKFYTPETSNEFDFSQYNYIIDAIDTVTGKIELVLQAQKADVPIISSMGTGNKIDPTAFEVADIFKTSVCPLARVMRYELKRRGIKKLKVVYSKEKPLVPKEIPGASQPFRRQVPGSTSFVPPVAGMIIAGEVIKDLISKK